MKTSVHYPEEVKWKVIEMKKNGHSNRTIVQNQRNCITTYPCAEAQTG
ncbi:MULTISPECIES: hypothetical protein [Bacillus]|nr:MULTISPECIES: hypothetical protein [Bacillus]MEB9338953.1 hypothetical protein [Bacillus cereus]CCW04769.1 Mobile element protein [Bacillus sp. GeD10]HEF1880063.1 hypothetical protein [Bacillus cereus]